MKAPKAAPAEQTPEGVIGARNQVHTRVSLQKETRLM